MAFLGFPSKKEREAEMTQSFDYKMALAKAKEKELKRQIEQKAKQQAKNEIYGKNKPGVLSGLGKQLRNIQKTVQGQSSSQIQQNRQQVTIQQNFSQPQQPQRFNPPNFFEHKDEFEVYGDEGLTFFDSRKKRGDGSTGGLFGI